MNEDLGSASNESEHVGDSDRPSHISWLGHAAVGVLLAAASLGGVVVNVAIIWAFSR